MFPIVNRSLGCKGGLTPRQGSRVNGGDLFLLEGYQPRQEGAETTPSEGRHPLAVALPCHDQVRRHVPELAAGCHKFLDRAAELLRLFDQRKVAGALKNGQLGVGQMPGHLLGHGHVGDEIVAADDD